MHARNKPVGPWPVTQSAQPPSGRTPLRSRGTAPLRYKPTSLVGRSPPQVGIRLARGSDNPRAGLRLARGLDAPSRARPRLDREPNAPSSEIPSRSRGSRATVPKPAPPAEAFNAQTPAGVLVKGESMPLRVWESCPATAPPTSRHCVTLCGVVSNRPAALYQPLPYGRRAAPSKRDGKTLEGVTRYYSEPTRDDAVTSGQWELSPPSPSALCDHPCHRDAIPATA
jgi:hypothetical protein